MAEDIAISVNDVSKMYKLYDNPMDRLKESLGLSRKKKYKEHYALNHVSFQVHKGETVGIIGTNGSGKSTILKSIIRELSPLGGSVFLDGTALEDYSDPDFAKKTAVVMTGRPDPELMTCFDVAAAGRYPYTGRFGILSKEDKKKVMDALEMVRCESLADVLFQNTSDGQKQRILLARAICQEPELLVLDEPISGTNWSFSIS